MAKKKPNPTTTTAACPCGSSAAYQHCCAQWHAGQPAPTALALMRSRYCAYVKQNWAYLRATWHPQTCPPDLDETASLAWQRLQIIATDAGGIDDNEGMVEFIATYKHQGRAHKLHERSYFLRNCQGSWQYYRGDCHDA